MKIGVLTIPIVLILTCTCPAQDRSMPVKPNSSVLIRAVRSGRNDPALALKKAKELVKQGADVNYVDRYGITALGYAADIGDLTMTKFLWSKGAKHDAGKERPLIIAAGRGRLEIVRFYIGKGVPIDTVSTQGNTALQVAQRWNQTEIINYLRSKGARQ